MQLGGFRRCAYTPAARLCSSARALNPAAFRSDQWSILVFKLLFILIFVQEEEEDAELDLSEMSEEDRAAVMDLLTPEERVAFQEMLQEQNAKNSDREGEL